MHRDGLSSRAHPSDQVQIHIGKGFDFDSEVEDLRKHVGRIKQVSESSMLHGAADFYQSSSLADVASDR